MALRGSDRAGEYGSVRGWLFGVARNVGLTAVRRRPRHHELRWDVEAKPPEHDCRAAEVKDAINELPAGMREALELRLQENLSYDEIAAALAIPVGTVRSRLHNAVRLLRERLRD